MARPHQRVCLQDGLKLDLNRPARKGFITRGAPAAYLVGRYNKGSVYASFHLIEQPMDAF
jgi:hypothetical protein